MKNVFFSIVIPTLNEEKYLPKLLDALEHQTVKNFEIIVVDAESSDHTQEIVRNYQKKFPLLILNSKTKNVSYQRNLGGLKAQGSYLVFFDADIWVNTTYLEELKRELIKSKADFASTRFVPDTSSLLKKTTAYIFNLIFYLGVLIGKPLMTGQNMIVKQNVFQKSNGFDPKVIYAEDIEYAQRLARQRFQGKIFWSLYHVNSIRRWQRDSWIKLVWIVFLTIFHLIFLGPIKKPLFEYKMGGKV